MLRLALAALIATICGTATVLTADEPDKQKLGDLARDLKAKSVKTRKAAAEEIGKLGKDAELITRQVCDAILDPNRDVSLAAFNALEKVSAELHKPIATILLDTNRVNVENAASRLGEMGEKARPAIGFVGSWLSNTTAQKRPAEAALLGPG